MFEKDINVFYLSLYEQYMSSNRGITQYFLF